MARLDETVPYERQYICLQHSNAGPLRVRRPRQQWRP